MGQRLSSEPKLQFLPPIPALNTIDSDVTLIGISSNVNYIGNITDPWFKALNQSLTLDLV